MDISTTPTTSSLEPRSPWSQMAWHGFVRDCLPAAQFAQGLPADAAARHPAINSDSRAWKTMRPMRPNPLMPIFTAIATSTRGSKTSRMDLGK